jgi:hypothetical protein
MIKKLFTKFVPEKDWFNSSNVSYEDAHEDQETHAAQSVKSEHGEITAEDANAADYRAFVQDLEGTKAALAGEQQNWQALMRGQIISVTTQKLFNYINVADQKAQVVIVLNSLIIPLALNELANEDFRLGATISIITAVLSILMAIICIYPKRRAGRKPDGSINHLHFADIAKMKEHDYLASFKPIFSSRARLAEEAIKDIHDVSRRILRPKFRALKMAYIIFFCGNVVAISVMIAHIWLQLF